jgi:hypothetical protein
LTGDALYAFVGTSTERRRRFFGVDLPASTQANLKFVLHYNETFAPPITLGTAPGVMYDNFYLAALAGAQGDLALPPAPADLARALSSFRVEGVPIEVGPTHIEEARTALRYGKSIDLQGAGLRLDLDSTRGTVSSDFAVYCLGMDATGRANDAVESGVILSFGDKKVSGKMRCP